MVILNYWIMGTLNYWIVGTLNYLIWVHLII